ncbi:pyridoxamine 5'-phosphate oxidase family protein [Kutzneria kofuensis]|uniref:Pyridoxamine 5'-phosphate oxidase n=1 Tax=Kutzneria kofuensis TaxID=103725 RepID=A0A7W9KGI7_9PSEU|nr:pyridoxamine 5'-phosphate oxidase family protein [Kutzneria kofuensis]MBB5891394.1 hypothetical protein [Kutzneria kofuensis]
MNDIVQALAKYSTMNIAYVDEGGDPQACAVFFALTENGSLVFVSSLSTRHGRALAAGGRVAFTAQPEGQHWTTLTGVQGRGTCVALTGSTLVAARATYARRFPFVAQNPDLRAALDATAHWEVRPDWLRLIDNTQGFGHKAEWMAAVSIE